jgi:signal transduction histidine kinase
MMLKANTKNKPAEAVDHERLNSLINSMADAVLAVDEDCKIVLYNGAALNIFDVNTIKVGSRLSLLFKPIDTNNQNVDAEEMVVAAEMAFTSRDLRLRYADSSLINLYLSIAPVHLGYGEAGQSGHVILLRDITHEKSLEEERDEFISVVSHELRTPIAIAEGNIGNAEYIIKKSVDISSIKQALKEAHSQILYLADMINDLSTLSRAERGKLQLDIEIIDIHKLFSSLIDNYAPQANAKKLDFKHHIDSKITTLSSSKLYVEEILQNFITNALKYTSEGQISLKAVKYQKGVVFSVSDSGIGISKGDQERVFDKFFRSENFRTRKIKGTGLGLYVTSKLARLIHAEIELSSVLSKGSTFTITIPNLK